MEIKIQMTEEDFIKFNVYHAENSPSQKRSYNMVRYLVPILTGLIMYVMGTVVANQSPIYWGIIVILFSAIAILIFPKQYRKIIQKQVRKMLEEGDNSNIFGEKTMIIDEENIKVFDETSSETTSRKNIKDVKVHDDLIFIYLSSVTAQIVPMRDLNEESKRYIIEELNKKGWSNYV